MIFKERLKEKRGEANLTQAELAKIAGVSTRTIQNYELGSRKPYQIEVVQKIADALNTTTEYLLGSSGIIVAEAHEKGGAKAARDIDELVSEVTGICRSTSSRPLTLVVSVATTPTTSHRGFLSR